MPPWWGADALEAGLDVSELEDGNFFHAEFNGEALYCGVFQINDAYYLYCVPEADLGGFPARSPSASSCSCSLP